MKRETILVLSVIALIVITVIFAGFRTTGEAVLLYQNKSGVIATPTYVYGTVLIAIALVLLAALYYSRKADKKK